MRKSLLFFCIAILLQVVVWVPALSRHLTPNHDTSTQLSGIAQSPESSPAPYTSYNKLQKDSQKISSEAISYRGINEMGSRPPNCEHKCSGCTPCVATQIPTLSGHFGIQYANYEPISWKCKCGPSVYSP